MSKNSIKYNYGTFIKINIANLLLYLSLYTLLPVLPAILFSTTASFTIQNSALLLLYFIGGIIIAGPFLFYIQDTFQRKSIALFSYLGISITALLFTWVEYPFTPLLLIAYGILYTLATSINTTIAIEVSPSDKRSPANKIASWSGRLGFLLGILFCCFLFPTQSNNSLIYASIGLSLAGFLLLLTIKLQFRAPLGSSLFHLDRFLLPRSWPFIINTMMVASVISCTLALFYHLGSTTTPPVLLLIFLVMGYLSSALFLFPPLQHIPNWTLIQIFIGILCIAIAYPLFSLPAYPYLPNYLLGLGIGLLIPEFLSLFVKISTHCQRGTANTSQSISWEMGLTLGIIIYYFQESKIETFQTLFIISACSILFFLLISYPYYRKFQIRK